MIHLLQCRNPQSGTLEWLSRGAACAAFSHACSLSFSWPCRFVWRCLVVAKKIIRAREVLMHTRISSFWISRDFQRKARQNLSCCKDVATTNLRPFQEWLGWIPTWYCDTVTDLVHKFVDSFMKTAIVVGRRMKPPECLTAFDKVFRMSNGSRGKTCQRRGRLPQRGCELPLVSKTFFQRN